mgnify:CR=1 FL=1
MSVVEGELWPGAVALDDLVKLSPLGKASMRRVNLHEAKTHLSRLVAEAVAGKGFVICKAGKPLVQVTRLEPEPAGTAARRRLGLLAGQCSVPEDFDQLASDQIIAMFEGEADAAHRTDAEGIEAEP